jgi:hypothetical protein
VQSARLEWWGKGLAINSSEMVAAHWVKVLAADASASRSLDVVPGNSVTASIMKDDDPASAGKPCSGF